MKQIFKTKAWDIAINEEDYILCFLKSIQVVDRKTGHQKQLKKTSFDQYVELYEIPGENKVIAFSFRKSCVDILDAKTLEILQSFKKRRKWDRDEGTLYYSKKQNSIYTSVTIETGNPENYSSVTYITKISLDTNEEEVIAKMKDKFAVSNFLEDRNSDNVLVCWKEFYKDLPGEGVCKGVSLQNLEEEISFNEDAEKQMKLCSEIQEARIVMLRGAWRNWKNELFYMLEICWKNHSVCEEEDDDDNSKLECIVFLPEGKGMIRRVRLAAVSENGKLFAYISGEKMFIYSLEKMNILEEINLKEYINVGSRKGNLGYCDFRGIKFLGNKYVALGMYTASDNVYLYELECTS